MPAVSNPRARILRLFLAALGRWYIVRVGHDPAVLRQIQPVPHSLQGVQIAEKRKKVVVSRPLQSFVDMFILLHTLANPPYSVPSIGPDTHTRQPVLGPAVAVRCDQGRQSFNVICISHTTGRFQRHNPR